MKILICGVDGYLGWALALYLKARGHSVSGCDDYLRRAWVAEVGSQSATPIASMTDRLEAFRKRFGENLLFRKGNLLNYSFVRSLLSEFKPEVIVHLGEMPSAPYSHLDVNHAVFTQTNNVAGTLNILYAMKETCPDSHLVKLGTMGEYGTPNIDIPEGFFEIEYHGRQDRLPFPRQAGSWYHQSKVHDSNNIMLACNIWGLRSTDVMQAVVYGIRIDEMTDDERLLSRFDFDQCFGTIVNRFCAMAVIGHPLTIYGTGHQKRGFLPLRDSMQCIVIAVENPLKKGEYRIFNQFEEVYSIAELARKVQLVAQELGHKAEIKHFENPRIEKEEHYYNPDHQSLLNLGYRPTQDMKSQLLEMVEELAKYRSRILARVENLVPDIRWSGERRKSHLLESSS